MGRGEADKAQEITFHSVKLTRFTMIEEEYEEQKCLACMRHFAGDTQVQLSRRGLAELLQKAESKKLG